MEYGNLEILYKDKDLVAVNKPSGLMVHRSLLAREARQFALQIVRNQTGRHVFPTHRLDRPTSGVLLFARNSEMAAEISKLFESGQIKKSYLAVVRGYIEDKGTIFHPLENIKHTMDSKKRSCRSRIDMAETECSWPAPDATHAPAKARKKDPAITDYSCLARVELPLAVDRYPTTRYSLVKLWPKTGRRHQLRRHMKHIFHPIVGDTVYGKSSHNSFFENHLKCKGLLLTARELSFIHPETGVPITIKAPLEEKFQRMISQLGWNKEVSF